MALEKALNRCHAVGLVGGLFDGNMLVWSPAEVDPQEGDFFEIVDAIGGRVVTKMRLDGGAGI